MAVDLGVNTSNPAASAPDDNNPSAGDDPDLLQLLRHRYGDGLVYIRDAAERRLYRLAVDLGLITSEGYLTPEGWSLLARHRDD